MSAYDALAEAYDSLTRDVPYKQMSNYYEALFTRENVRVKTILDLACGTGTLTCLLSERGYEMIGADASAEMLAVAAGKAAGQEKQPMFIHQPMEGLDLYGTVDAVICSLDGLNHVPPGQLPEVLRRVRLFLEPGGLFISDILTPEALKKLDGEIFLDETDDIYCVWRAEFDETLNACFYDMDIFMRLRDQWVRNREGYAEYAYDPSDLEKLLDSAGFTDVKLFGDLTFDAPIKGERRLFMTAKKPL